MGYRPAPRFVYELHAKGLEIRATCWACKHTSRLPAMALAQTLIDRGRSVEIDRLHTILRCTICRYRNPEVRVMPIADDRERAHERRKARD